MGWPDLTERVRFRARTERLELFDAACGYGSLFMDLFTPPFPEALYYIGADLHQALATIKRPKNVGPDRALFLRWDIADPLPSDTKFDVVVCRAAIHHTPNPPATFRNLVSWLAPDGIIAITTYAKKTPMRESCDDVLRSRIVPLEPQSALRLVRQFTELGRDLQACDAFIDIKKDLPALSIKAGRYGIHEFIYNHFIKCWFHEGFGDRYSDIVNFDWYHPPYAFRYDRHEIENWFSSAGLEIVAQSSTKAQHYFEGKRGKT